jgi:hypothetical protein
MAGLTGQVWHWKVTGIAGRQTRSNTHGGSGNETAGLAEGHTATGKLAPPPAGLFALNASQGSKPQAVQKARDARISDDSAAIAPSLRPDPTGRIGVPVMLRVLK